MMMNTENSNLCNSYSVVRPMVRDNSSPQQMRKRGFYMVDSTYTVPCNPNSMRDAGPLRNRRAGGRSHAGNCPMPFAGGARRSSPQG